MDLLKDYRVIPLKEGEDFLEVGVPRDYEPLLLEEIRFLTGKDLKVRFLTEEEYAKKLQEALSLQKIELEGEEGEESKEDILLSKERSPAVELVNNLLIRASLVGASDIHVEPYENGATVRMRLDGVLHDYLKIPKNLYPEVVSRLKVMANLNVAERRIPQDGRIRVRIGGKEIDLRVSTVPVVFGERVVLRLLDRSAKLLTLEELGLSKKDVKTVKELCSKPYGMVLITGPTGAGKTTTLYAMLLYIKSPKKNIITIEDPVEYQIKGISQIQVNPKVGLTFAKGLRSILRQDPDVIMVGEIRDEETAQISIHSALTGHLVLSTLHTNDAPSAITRLADMGIEPFLIASSLEGVIAQRLVRRICENCKEDYEPSREELEKLGLKGKVKLYRGRGCENCLYTGYRGRIGIFEVLRVSERIKRLIIKTQDSNRIREEARKEGFKSMFEDGLEKVLKGITTASELISAISGKPE